MKNLKKYIAVGLMLVVAGSCETYKLPEIAKPSAGTKGLDLTKMVSVGNSLAAGFMNGALYTAGQANSYPSIIATQMALAGGGSFSQPDIGSVNGFFGTSGPTILGRLRLKIVNGSPSPTPQLPGDAPATFTGDKSKLNNFGVPGVTLQTAQLAALGGPSTGNPAFNPLYARFATNPGVSTLIGDAAAALNTGGTFFTFWLGNNDVLGYATGGASNPAILTSQADFKTRLASALAPILAANGGAAEGAIANIPDVGTIPFFTTVTWNPIVFLSSSPTSVATVAQLNGAAAYGGFNAALDGLALAGAITTAEAAKRKVIFKTGSTSASGANGAVIIDETLTNLGSLLAGINPALAGFAQVRQATKDDRLTLTAGSVLPLGQGVSTPLTDQYVLLPSEQTEIQTVVNGFNASIAEIVSANNSRLVLVDTNAALKALTPPPGGAALTINGSTITASILPPAGAFSLDGVHPNARGAGYIANLFIQAINAKWGSSIPLCNPNNYPGNELPSL